MFENTKRVIQSRKQKTDSTIAEDTRRVSVKRDEHQLKWKTTLDNIIRE